MNKAIIKNLDNGMIIPVMFNPEQYTDSWMCNWQQSTSGDQLYLNFDSTQRGDFTVKLFFDTYEKKIDVRSYIKLIQKLGTPTVPGNTRKRPPLCLFTWGSFAFKGVVKSIKTTYSLFLATGIPVRATADLTMQAVYEKQEITDKKGAEACRKAVEVKQGARLDLLAATHLGDPLLWPDIARENGISDPLRFPRPEDIGRILAIPDL